MSIKKAVSAVALSARALTDTNRMVISRSINYPVGRVASSFINDASGNKVGFGESVALESENSFAEGNRVLEGVSGQEITDQINSLAANLQSTLFNARNVVIPTIKTLTEQYQQRLDVITEPNLAVNIFEYVGVHQQPELLNHLQDSYSRTVLRNEYRSLILPNISAENIVTLVADNTKHFDRELALSWLLDLGSERITAVWSTLFKSRVLEVNSIPFLRYNNIPLMIDELLLAYVITEVLRDHPQDVVGESLTLEEWTNTMALMHEFLGNRLLKAYSKRMEDREAGLLVLKFDAEDPMESGEVSVLVNGDVYEDWLNQNGDIQQLLGAAVFDKSAVTVKSLALVGEDLARRWASYYKILLSTITDKAQLKRRRIASEVFRDTSIVLPNGLPTVDPALFNTHLANEIRALKDYVFDNPYDVFTKLVCGVYYREHKTFIDLIEALKKYSEIHPEATTREVAIEAVIEITADWLVKQMSVVDFTPVVDPNASLSNEGANVGISEENKEVAENVGDIHEEELPEPQEAETGDETETEETEETSDEEPMVDDGVTEEVEEESEAEAEDK